ncbi:amiloride-sensitive amine oxidase [copper-containing]-like [Mercenaria mercenaria]|uniref:amiloride-sensitive amine oxidase [copper-containing]-like n=1 Tax=Mercenaria mercenaria TaxID=6596 RepID=UPI00234F6C14|nr:amiloride-sensitive amine oxidase [copper-containing]-like [Mercenaria mercenaria]
MSLGFKPKRYTAAIPEDSIPEVNTDSDSSDEDHGTVRTHRWPTSKRPRISVVSEANPSPRVSAFEAPNPALFGRFNDEDSEDSDIKKALIQRIAGTCLAITTIVLIVVVIYMASKIPDKQFCKYSDKDFVKPRDLDNPQVFDDLTPEEYETVNDFMLRDKEMNLIPFQSAVINSSYIYMIDLFLPRKDETIRYLDNGSKKPTREAIVTVVRGDRYPPIVEEYIVSPTRLPDTHRLYKNPSYKRYPIPYTSRPIDDIDYKFLFPVIINKITEELYPLLMESFGLCYHNCTKGLNCLKVYDLAPRGQYSGDRKTWTWLFPDVEGFYIHPLGLEFLIDHSSTDTNKWRMEQIIYNGQMFQTVSALMDAYRIKSLKLIHIHSFKDQSLYSSYEARGELPERPLQGPKLTEPDGKRFQVNGQRVFYKKWNFNYHMRPTTGLQIFDVKFNGTRIAYEISLQEVLVLYSGYGPTQGTSNYYDISRLLGASSMELARGVDCPDSAVYLDTYFFANSGSTKIFKNNVCVFESNGGMPLRRHYQNNYDGGYDFYGGIVDYHLIIRTVANVWNYDYVFDYIFHTNGAVEVKASATGYVHATFRLQEEDIYGSPIHDHVTADLHVHIFNYKVDLDITSTSNRYMVHNIKAETQKHPWLPNKNITKLLIKPELISTETGASTAYNSNTPQYHVIISSDAKSQYGSSKGYRILNKSPVSHLLSDQSVTAAAKWVNYSIIVTKRKESERDSTSIFAQNDPWDPLVDFQDFIDGENLVDEDLVAWVTIGSNHIPVTEDIPSTPTTWNQFSFFLTPHNYFAECPSLYSADNVLIRPSNEDNENPSVKTYGRSFKSKCIPQSIGPFNYNGIRR